MIGVLLTILGRLLPIPAAARGVGEIAFAISPPAGGLMAPSNKRMSQTAWYQDRGPASNNSILHYSQGDDFKHNRVTALLTEAEMVAKFPLQEPGGRWYNTATPIFCQPSMGARPDLCYEYKGVRNPHPSGMEG